VKWSQIRYLCFGVCITPTPILNFILHLILTSMTTLYKNHASDAPALWRRAKVKDETTAQEKPKKATPNNIDESIRTHLQIEQDLGTVLNIGITVEGRFIPYAVKNGLTITVTKAVEVPTTYLETLYTIAHQRGLNVYLQV
jgi:hypothetical protein